jgi:Family of unknown function (DUF6499)
VTTNTENHHIDDWNWEFLRRNTRYKNAYKSSNGLKLGSIEDSSAPLCALARLECNSDLNALIEVMDGSGVTNGMENSPYI